MSRLALWIALFVVIACNRPTLREEVLDDSTFETTDGTEHHWLEEQKKENELEEREDPPSSDQPEGRLGRTTPRIAAGSIQRRELVSVLDAGLGRFLQNVQTEPDFEHGTFVGFRIVRLCPGHPRYATLDLRRGDTVTSVNGRPIGRPEQAAEVWESLRVADELVVAYRRGGETRSLKFAIVD